MSQNTHMLVNVNKESQMQFPIVPSNTGYTNTAS